MLTVFSFIDGKLVKERHANAQRILLEYPLHHLPTEEDGVLEGRGIEDFIHDDDAVRSGLGKDLVNPDKVILELSPQIPDVFFLLKMGE